MWKYNNEQPFFFIQSLINVNNFTFSTSKTKTGKKKFHNFF